MEVPYSFADVAERLMARFEGLVALDVVVKVARESEADLAGPPAIGDAAMAGDDALADAVERHAASALTMLIEGGLVEPTDAQHSRIEVPQPRSPS
jgi:hypothetical protein